jgi:hypothetical protein
MRKILGSRRNSLNPGSATPAAVAVIQSNNIIRLTKDYKESPGTDDITHVTAQRGG